MPKASYVPRRIGSRLERIQDNVDDNIRQALLDRFSACVAEHFEVEHATFQIEPASHRGHEELGEAHP